MAKKKFEELLEFLKTAKRVEATGFSDEVQVKTYLTEKEKLIEDVAHAIEELSAEQEAEIGALKAQVGGLAESLKKETKTPEFSQEDMLANIGKLVSATFRKDFDQMIQLGMTPQNRGSSDQDWTDPRSISFDKDHKRFVNKDSLGSPLGGTTDGQYVINTIYERELMKYAQKQSAMMGKVRTIPMAGNTISWPTLDRYNTHLYWHNNPQGSGGNYKEAGKPAFGPRVELTCQTLAGWIPWYDLFQDDIQVNVQIGQLFLEMFTEQYGQEFDYQCLFANAAPFTGIFSATGAREHVVSGASPTAVTLEDLTNAPLKVPSIDRVNGMWIVSEDFVSWLAAHKNVIGDYAWMSPIEGSRPGMIAGKPYIEVPSMKSIFDVTENERFAWFGNPQDIWHGNRMGVELRTFRETESSLLNGEEFIRFRKRDGFKVVRTDRSVFLKTAARS